MKMKKSLDDGVDSAHNGGIDDGIFRCCRDLNRGDQAAGAIIIRISG